MYERLFSVFLNFTEICVKCTKYITENSFLALQKQPPNSIVNSTIRKYTRLSKIGLFVSEAFFFLIGSIKARQLTMTKSSSQNHLHRLVNPFSTNCKFDRVNKVPFTRAPMIFMCGSACFNRVGGLLLLLLLTGSPSSWREVTDLLSYCYHSP